MQADSEKLRQAWIKAVQNSIATAFRDKAEDDEVVQLLSHPASSCHARGALLTVRCVCQKMDRKSSTSTGSLDSTGEVKERSLKGESALQRVMAIGGNSICCDCGQPEPSWASINLGITLCIQCSGIHRCVCVCVCVCECVLWFINNTGCFVCQESWRSFLEGAVSDSGHVGA